MRQFQVQDDDEVILVEFSTAAKVVSRFAKL